MSKKPPSFEEALKELETLADQIERGEIGLAESVAKYEQGMKLVEYCRRILTEAEQRIQKLQAPAEPLTPSAVANDDAEVEASESA